MSMKNWKNEYLYVGEVTVGEMIEFLKKYPKDWSIAVEGCEDFYINIFADDGVIVFDEECLLEKLDDLDEDEAPRIIIEDGGMDCTVANPPVWLKDDICFINMVIARLKEEVTCEVLEGVMLAGLIYYGLTREKTPTPELWTDMLELPTDEFLDLMSELYNTIADKS